MEPCPRLSAENLAAQWTVDLFRIGEISCPTRYFEEASSINFRRSSIYGLGVLATAAAYRLGRLGMGKRAIFADDPAMRLAAAGRMAVLAGSE